MNRPSKRKPKIAPRTRSKRDGAPRQLLRQHLSSTVRQRLRTTQEAQAQEFEDFLSKVASRRKTRKEFQILEDGKLLHSMAGRVPICQSRKTAEIIAVAFGLNPRSDVTEVTAYVPERRGRKAKTTYDEKSYESRLRKAELAYGFLRPEKRPSRFTDQRRFVEEFFPPANFPALKGNPHQKRYFIRKIMNEIQRRLRQIALK